MVPFVQGGARNIVDWLAAKLVEHGHEVEIVFIPFIDHPDVLFDQMAAFRWIDLSAADRVICFRPPAHHVPHDNKVLWFIHHIRRFYDLWGASYFPESDTTQLTGLRDALVAADNAALAEAKHVFTNSQIVSDRLSTYNGVDSEVLYPPLYDPSAFQAVERNDEIVAVCRLEHHKRQHLLVEAMAHTTTPVQLRLCGTGNPGYVEQLRDTIACSDLADRVILDDRWIDDDEKVDVVNRCLAAAYVPENEDSYGYPSLEAAHAAKAVLTTTDSGGVPELITDGENGLIAEPTPEGLADAMDQLYLDRARTERMGDANRERVDELQIDWDHVIDRVLA